MTPTIALALEDFLPVLLTLLALLLLTRMIFSVDQRSGYAAVLGLILVVLGGTLKATSKLLWVVFGESIPWMENSLFLLLAPGFASLTWAIWCSQRRFFRKVQTRYVSQVPVLFIFFIGAGNIYFNTSGQGRSWFFVLLSLVVVMSSLMVVLLSKYAWHYGLKSTALLFLLYLVITLLMNGMAQTPSSSLEMEWAKQSVNTAAAAILAFASWRLWIAAEQVQDSTRPDGF
jgi:hypothetical protein